MEFPRGKGFKRPKFPKERGCSCEIIFPEGHAKLAILEDLLTKNEKIK